MGNTFQIDAYDCPCCYRRLSGASGVGNDALHVKNGDLSVCAYCGSIHEFLEVSDSGMAVRMLRPADLAALEPQVVRELIRAQAIVHSLLRQEPQ